MAIVHSYTRFSTNEQADGDSLRRQIDRSVDFCNKHGHNLSELRFQDLGRSGFRRKNLKDSALAAFLIAIEKGQVKAGDILLVEAIDRLSRSGVRETQKLINEIHEAKVDIAIIFPQEQIFRHDTDNPLIDAIVLAAYADLAHQYSARLSDFGKNWWKEQRKQAKEHGTAVKAVIPWWINREGEVFNVIEDNAEVIRLIYKLAIEGMGASKICKHLNGKMVPAPRRKSWNKTFVREVIRGRQTLGEIVFKELDINGKRVDCEDVIPNYYPAIVDEDTWVLANSALDRRCCERGPDGDFINLFKELVWNVNDNCPAHMSTYQQPRKKNGKTTHKVTVRRLKSKDAIAMVPGADHATIDLVTFEKCTLAAIQGVDVSAIGDDSDEQDAELRRKMADFERVSSTMEEIRADLVSGKSEYSFIKTSIHELSCRRDELDASIKSLQAATANTTKERFANLINLCQMPELRIEIREAIKCVVERIWVLPVKTGDHRSSPVVVASQIVYRTGDRYSFIFEKPRGRNRKDGRLPPPIVCSGILLPNLEETSGTWRARFLSCWKKEKRRIQKNED